MSRPQILALLIGIGLIAFGLLYGGAERGGAGAPREIARSGSAEETVADPLPAGAEGRARRAVRSNARPAGAERVTEVALEITVRNSSTGAPAAGAIVGLWRASTGVGPAYRSAQRLVAPDPKADADGRITIVAPLSVPIEVSARTADLGPTTMVDIGSLGAADGPVLQVEILVEPPPPPLAVHVVDRRGQPIPGAGLYVIEADPGLWSEFPGPAKPALRTDGDGRCVLDGDVRSARWLAVDAAGKAPLAVRVASIGAATSHEFVLDPEVRAELHVVRGEGKPVPGTNIELRFELDGYAVQRNALTNARGRAEIRNLPFGVDVTPVVGLDEDKDGYLDDEGQTFAPVRFNREQTVEGSQEMASIELVLD